jgi:transposase
MDGWMDMPPKYGSYKTVWGRHKKWSIKGVWKNKYYEFPNITWLYFWIAIAI